MAHRRWEVALATITNPPNADAVAAKLNEAGAEGWEPVCLLPSAAPGAVSFLVKRERSAVEVVRGALGKPPRT